MNDWKKLFQIEGLRELLNSTETEIQESFTRNKIQTAYSVNKDSTLDNFYLGADGQWNVYNPVNKTWSVQDEKPMVRKPNEEEIIEDIINRKASDAADETVLLGKKRKGAEVNEKLKGEQMKVFQRKLKKKDKQKEKRLNKWYHAKINTNVYVSGLPRDTSENELIDMFLKCGFLRKDEKTGKERIKLYRDEQGNLKGDGLISYLREESVQMAIDRYNDTEMRPGYKITVEKAKFEQKGDYKAREVTKIDEMQRYKRKTDIERLLGWDDDESKGLKIVVLKHMFSPNEFYVSLWVYSRKTKG
jgi:hypothetical protein